MTETWQNNYRRALAAVTEGFCPTCLASLAADGLCLGITHGPISWHLCRESDLATEEGPAVTAIHMGVPPFRDRCSWCSYTPAWMGGTY